jgi:hypothetical protein
VRLRLHDLKGNVGSCDASTVAVVRGADRVQNVSFFKVPGDAGALTILNGEPGLTSAVVVVNGARSAEVLLSQGARSTVELPGLKAGPTNTITLRLSGDIGATALIVVGAAG